MAVSELVPIGLRTPGAAGLNMQDSPLALAPEFATIAYNAVIDNSGRLGPRNGWTHLNTVANADLGTSTVTCVHEYMDKNGNTEIIVIGNKSIFTLSGNTLTTIYTDAAWTGANWKAVNFNGYCYFFQRGHDPLIYDGTTVAKLNSIVGYSGTVQLAHEVLAAYGRLWTCDVSTDKFTVKWSDTLLGAAWTGGASGSLDITSALTGGQRPITALAAFNGNLVIFCDKRILIYSGADSAPSSNLALVEVIEGIGCIGRDGVQVVGEDVFFVSDTGLRSLGRVIDQKSAPLFDISRNVRDEMIYRIATNNSADAMKTVYSDYFGMFLTTFTNLSSDPTFYFDTKQRLEQGVCKAAKWSLKPTAMCTTVDRRVLMGFANGKVGYYNGWTDNTVTYRFKFATGWLDGGDASKYKILKSMLAILIGTGNTTMAVRWAVDYEDSFDTEFYTFPDLGGDEYNIGEYNIAEYSSNARVWKIPNRLSRYGRVFQIRLEWDVAGPLSLQQLDIFVKPGRTSLQ